MKKQKNSLLTLPLPKCLLTRPRIPALLQSSRRKGLVLYRPKRALFLPIKQFKIKRFKILILQNWSWKMTFGASCSRNMKTRWLPYHVTLGMLTGSVHVYTRLWRIAEYVSCLVLGKPRSAWWTGGMLYIYLLQHKASWRLLHNFIWSGLPVVCYSEYCSVWTQCLEVCFQCDATRVSVDFCYVPAPNAPFDHLFHCIVLAPEFIVQSSPTSQPCGTIFSMLLIIYWPVYVFWLRSLR